MLSAVRLSWFSGGLLALALSSFSGTARFQPDSYLQHVKYLASDELKGRGNGTPELERAAEYIAQQFQTAGLQPAETTAPFFKAFN